VAPEIDLTHLVDLVNQQSRFIRLSGRSHDAGAATPPAPGPNRLEWHVTLAGGADAPQALPSISTRSTR
jgi:hypothetical protein